MAEKKSFSNRNENFFIILAFFCIALSILVLVLLIGGVAMAGVPRLSLEFLLGFPSRSAEKAGILPALVGSFYLILLTAVVVVPLGVGAAVYLEEYGGRGIFAKIVEVTMANLAGVPSILFGILGLQIFVRALDLQRSLISGALTMALLVMPVVVIAAREALRSVPKSVREAAFALGATKAQMIVTQVLPLALPGILTGSILALSRAIGEAAPLITLGALMYVPFLPDGFFSAFTVLPIQAFNWLSRPQQAFHQNAAAAILVLLVVLLVINSTAIVLRLVLKRRIGW